MNSTHEISATANCKGQVSAKERVLTPVGYRQYRYTSSTFNLEEIPLILGNEGNGIMVQRLRRCSNGSVNALQ